ncbi:MAG: aminotransferase class V-fold PLP-dependent enzyme [Phycisphaerales bacterium]|jgi:isopenicillin-N epimerase|nr:aminotransferase class V-fold PLP-dependent enzyme [Phycisphaerales bacterium]
MGPPPSPWKGGAGDAWSLAEGWVFLNPGSFGLRLRSVQAHRQKLLEQMEAQPVAFLERVAPSLHEDAVATLSGFIGADAAGIGFVSNATEGVAAVLSSLGLSPGDTVLLGDQAYGAVVAACNWVTRGGVRRVPVSAPVARASDITDAWTAALRDRPTLAIVDHVTSGTAIVQPARDIAQACRAAGVPVLVDGAHAPGMIELEVDEVGADWYAGNLHKWVGAPSGAGFLWTAPPHRDTTRPVALSHDVADGYQAAFRWQGTRDVTPWLTVPHAIGEVRDRWGWPELRAWQRAMATWAGAYAAAELGTCTADASGGAMTAAMTSVALPDSASSAFEDRFALRDAIAARHRVEVAIDELCGRWWMRMSFGGWNTPEDVYAAVAAMQSCLARPDAVAAPV